MFVDKEVYEFIKDLREKHPRVGKKKIKILLDEFCQKKNLECISESKIGRIIKRNNWFFHLGVRTKKRVRRDKKRVFGYEVKQIGDLLQLDCLVRFEHGLKRYLFTAIETQSRFAFAFTYNSKSSLKAADFIQKLTRVSPFAIRAIQTDNGSEFLNQADKIMAKKGIVHFFTYPRCPRSNAFIERFNRTLQEEFVEEHRDLLETNLHQFNLELMDYLVWYNTKRPHASLNYQVPMKVILINPKSRRRL